ncbi:MAG: hypothetical protein RI902_889 [Pseudomonadota bacterium]|jgi:hypothetical protein
MIGASVLRMFSVESKQTTSDAVGFRLEQLVLMGLESNFTLLRSMGATTTLLGDSQQLMSSSSATYRTATNCNYFPRTDDAKLPAQSGGSFQDSALLASGTVTCLTARPQHASLAPSQLARYSSISSSNLFDATDINDRLNTLNSTTDTSFRSVFPWIRYPSSDAALNDRFGSSENMANNLNQCGLMSQFKSTASQSGVPLQRYRYQQDFDGLGYYVDLGTSTMNIYQDGLTLEAWVWMGNPTNSQRTWQRIFDIGRTSQDGNVVFAYDGTSGKIQLHVKGKGNCGVSPRVATTDPTPDSNCGEEFFALSASELITVPTNNVDGSSLDTSGGNDLWFYVAARVDPASVTSPKVRIYTQCKRDGGGTISGTGYSNGCNPGGTPIRGSGTTGLYKRIEKDISWSTRTYNNYQHYRKTWVGKSHWGDADFLGKMKDLRVWNTTLTEDQLNQPITVSVNDNNTQSSIITNTDQKLSLRISPLYTFGNDRLILFTVKEFGGVFDNTWRLVSCAWNNQSPKRVTKSLRFRVLGSARPEVMEYLSY